MSDFDKEAEREKLRKKYERDKADREATQRMSDLLLKGATMTNTHCNVCGDPFFTQDGVTFCPSCHGGPEGVEASVGDADAAAAEGSQPRNAPSQEPASAQEPAPTQSPETATDASPEPTGDTPTETDDGEAATTTPAAANDGTAPTEANGGAATTETATADANATTPPSPTASARASTPDPSLERPALEAGDLAEAHDALTGALERFAREAATTDDPRYAKECLEAAREAAEALAALR
ncbi:Sjogren's syndrome/scleroderma autoantigen 1 family protein [Natronobiforma cellulositropha]|uniref:Sjogren's syndrome/scleroderma autoantigen 1 family protein n=1 Tax=Natronobiforma cellulositropha TaxID=1679076 RepID=UPI0021D578B5|nr:Sjogren's syndrome/scleroderma autoantigen 1 family protein [Natronobiforma cellulositropha]